jgi:hypothetical protein
LAQLKRCMEHILTVVVTKQSGVCPMRNQDKQGRGSCPVTVASARAEAQAAFDKAADFCESCEFAFGRFEKNLFVFMVALGVLLIRLFLTARRQRLDVTPFLQDGRYRLGPKDAQRTLKTAYGEVTYGRHYLIARDGGSHIFPLDAALGLSNDRLSPWMMQWVARLATRMSFAASRMVCKAVLNWSPATETIEQVVLGLGRYAAPFVNQLQPPPQDGDVLVIEVDGKSPPTATEAELSKRRGPRRPRHEKECPCGCQRHRGKAKRQARGPKKRRKKGDKSKNGKEATVVVMYTLQQGADGKLHGPLNKKMWATFAGRKAAALWARAQATRRGFGPNTGKIVQIVMDGVESLKSDLETLFPQAIFTLDIWHVVERLWALGRHYHEEGSEALAEWVEDLKALLFAGETKELVAILRDLLRQVPVQGPGNKGRRDALTELIGYMEKRLDMMRYGEWLAQDLVIGSGQVEGTVRQLVGERFDCAGMRWRRDKAEALLHLRCIELNGDWQHFFAWTQKRILSRLRKGKRIKVLTDQPLTLAKAA